MDRLSRDQQKANRREDMAVLNTETADVLKRFGDAKDTTFVKWKVAKIAAITAFDAKGRAEIRADVDELTGLFRRGAFLDRVKETGSVKGAVMFFDLDNFKKINDKLGHEVGDESLRNFAFALLQKVGASGIVGRWGGEEMVVYFPILTAEEALKLFEGEKFGVSFTSAVSGIQISITSSAGIAELKADGDDLKSAMTRADMAMYFKKKNEKDGIVIFEPKMEEFFKLVEAKEKLSKQVQQRAQEDAVSYKQLRSKFVGDAISERELELNKIFSSAFADLSIAGDKSACHIYIDSFLTNLAR